jgi:hypothetical protein
MTTADATDTLPVHDLDALRATVTALLALKLKPAEIKAMLLQADAPASAWLEAMVVMWRPTTPMGVARALASAADRPDLLPGLIEACRRWKVHPASLVALETRGPLGLGLALGLPRKLVRSFPGKRRARTEQGHWAPPPDFLGETLPEDLVLQDLKLCEQPRLIDLPNRLWVSKMVTLDRLPNLRSLGRFHERFAGTLIVRACPNLPNLPALGKLSSLQVDGQPWSRFPAEPIEATQISLTRMRNLEILDPRLAARRLTLSLCPTLRELPPRPNLIEAPPQKDSGTRCHTGLDTWMPDTSSSQYGLTLIACHALRSLPEGFRISGTLLLQDCWGFEALPSQLDVCHLILRRLPSLRLLPSGLHVRGHLILEGLANLARLPEGLQVDGDLVIHQMPQPLALPSNLAVRGKLRIHPADAELAWPDRPKVFPAVEHLSHLQAMGLNP